MKYTYEIVEHPVLGKTINAYGEDGTMLSIPMDEANSDYQRYLNPDAEQSTPSVTSGD
jgi:hypothetical protein